MFKLCRIAPIFCFNRPFIWHKLGLMGSWINHGLYRKYHARFYKVSGIFWSLMIHIRLFMKCYSCTMTRVLAYNSVPMSLGMPRYFVANISKSISRIHLLDPDLKTGFGHCYEIFPSFWNFSYTKHLGCVTEVAIYYGSYIHVDNIPLFENLFLWRYAMTYNIISRYAGITRIPMVSYTGWNTSII